MSTITTIDGREYFVFDVASLSKVFHRYGISTDDIRRQVAMLDLEREIHSDLHVMKSMGADERRDGFSRAERRDQIYDKLTRLFELQHPA